MNAFSALGLPQPLVEAITAIGFHEPTPIQAMAIPQLLQEPRDLIALAQTGTGKTAAFGLPLLERIAPHNRHPQALILAPTRELALQITGELQRFASRLPEIRIVTVYGGADIRRQARDLKGGAQLVVATPGRLKDLLNRKLIDLNFVHTAVLDEADEMLNMGFRPDLEHILAATPPDKQTWLFSATMSKEVQSLSRRYLTNPIELGAGGRNTVNEDIEHQYILVNRNEKYETLTRILDSESDFFGLLFCRTRNETRMLAERLSQDGYPADALHGELSQVQRERVMGRFRRQQLKLLVATDVAARGLDIDDLTHVLHFSMPEDIAFYTHRSGRTGRAGKQGISLAFLSRGDLSVLRQIEKQSKAKFRRVDAPSESDRIRKLALEKIQSLKDVEVREEIRPLLPDLTRELAGLTREELIARLASQAIAAVSKAAADFSAERMPMDGPKTKLFINIGRHDGYDKGAFLRLLCEQANITGETIGHINLQQKHTFFEVDQSLGGSVISAFAGSTMDGRPIRINSADGPPAKRNTKGRRMRK